MRTSGYSSPRIHELGGVVSEQSGGPGWWQASDGRWYRPEQHPDYRAPAPLPPPPPLPTPIPSLPTLGEGSESHRAGSPWYTRKRFVVPIALVILLIIVGALAGEPEQDTQVASRDNTAPEAPVDSTGPSLAGTSSTAIPSTTSPPITPPTTVDPFAGETVSQKNARRKAAEYLDYSAFSHSGLVKQLEFEGFSTQDAIYGVDAVNADWFEQAAKKAAEYMNYSSFSRNGLIQQLKFEGFTQQQAEHGANSVGL